MHGGAPWKRSENKADWASDQLSSLLVGTVERRVHQLTLRVKSSWLSLVTSLIDIRAGREGQSGYGPSG